MNIHNLKDLKRGTDIDSFIDYLGEAATTTYFHNLSFDGIFIIDYVMKNGWKWVDGKPGEMEFSTLIDKMGKFYTITINVHGVVTEIRDSLKKIPMPVAAIAKAFDLPEPKGEIDYDKPRPAGYIPTEEEWDYLRRDVEIVARALAEQLSHGLTNLTVGSDAMAEFKKVYGGQGAFTKSFPVLPASLDQEIRQAYRGGFTYADPRFSRRIVGAGDVYDVNSLYPYVMHEDPLPFGKPNIVDYIPDDGLFITSVTVTAKLKEDHIPCIQIKRSRFFNGAEYVKAIDEPTTLTCTSVDLDLWSKHYDLNIITCNGTFTFDSERGMIADYIDKWMEVKANSTGGKRTIAKLMLNSLYGKFAKSTNTTGKKPILDGDHVKLVSGPADSADPVYTPVGCFVTAWARHHTVTSAQLNYDRFLYADTDSLHLLGTEKPHQITVHPTNIGAWKHEATFSRAIFVRAKQYCEVIDGVPETHIAGLPKYLAAQITPEDLLEDQRWYGKLMPTKVPGGVVLKPTSFTFTA